MIGNTRIEQTPGLAINSRGEMFGASHGGLDVNLYRIDAATGGVVHIGDTGLLSVGGMAFDENDRLYATDLFVMDLYEIDPSSAYVVNNVPMSVGGIGGLAFDPTDGTLYASSAAPSRGTMTSP